jgi:hypothetical protein
MSVIFFGTDELANVARACVDHPLHSDYGRELLTYYCEKLAIVSKWNAVAYNRTYDGQNAAGHPARVIMEEAQHFASRIDKRRALRTAELLDYNCIANDGRQPKNVRYFSAVSTILCALVRSQAS